MILNADEVIKSPGIPNDAPIILKLKNQGTPIISEIEFAGRYTNAKMICITGSNGKTTTTSLIYHIFKKAGLNVGLAGNIGQVWLIRWLNVIMTTMSLNSVASSSTTCINSMPISPC